jgi:hypothetical protein
MSFRLKDCPSCDGRVEMEMGAGCGYWVYCPKNCGHGELCDEPEIAASHWNKHGIIYFNYKDNYESERKEVVEENSFADGQIVYIDNGVFKGKAMIKGISSVALPVIGATYIVKDISCDIYSKKYPYSYFTCCEVHMDKVETEVVDSWDRDDCGYE